MALEVNGAAILAAISKTPEAFGMSDGQVNALAQTALTGRYKDKLLDLPRLKAIGGHLGREEFALSLDFLKSTELTAFAKRLDGKNSDLKTASDHERRLLIVALTFGEKEPVAAASRPLRAPKPKPTSLGSKTGKAMQSKALRARRAK